MGASAALASRLRAVFSQPVVGWDFPPELADWVEPELPWDYREIVESHLPGREALLDMDTGGAEFLASLRGAPPLVWATEGYEPNIQLARTRMKSYGYQLKPIARAGELPFSDESFDVITNRHGEFDPPEVRRCLRPGGVFVTQQVGGLDAADLNQALGAPPMEATGWCLTQAMPALEASGLTIVKAMQHVGSYQFRSIDAVVYYLRAISWQIPDFTPDGYADRLAVLDELIARDGSLSIISQRFLIVTTKPARPTFGVETQS